MRRTITTCALVQALCLGGALVLAHTQESAGKIPITTSSDGSARAVSEGARPGRETAGHRRPPLLRAGGREGQQLRARLCGPGQHRADDREFIDAVARAVGAGGQRQRRRAAHDWGLETG